MLAFLIVLLVDRACNETAWIALKLREGREVVSDKGAEWISVNDRIDNDVIHASQPGQWSLDLLTVSMPARLKTDADRQASHIFKRSYQLAVL